MALIGGFRSDLSVTRKTDGNFGNVSAGVLFSKVAYQFHSRGGFKRFENCTVKLSAKETKWTSSEVRTQPAFS